MSAAGPQVTRLTLTHFRNHAQTDMRFDSMMVAFTGANGAGKTNILEALSLLSPGRGLRRAKLLDMIGTEAPTGFAVAADLIPTTHEEGDDPVKIGTGLASAQATSRETRIDRVPIKSSEEMLELANILWLTPAMDGLFTGGVSDRRRFFDRMVMALHPSHGRSATRFEQSMRARNKMLDEGVHDPIWFEGIEAQMSEAASAMQSAREATLTLLSDAIEEARDAVDAFPHALIALSGFESFESEEGYRSDLASNRLRDKAAGRTLEGPHRVDLLVRHGPKDVEARLASTGEQKALLIGLILAQARLVKQETGQAALLLLDEVAAHLDAGRRAALYELCRELGGQTFMTGTDASLFDALDSKLDQDADHFIVDDGKVERRG